ncbi:MAG: hypothetical protein Q8P78_02130 [bacterium]|nr:hypothetical protein [bacterium]
MQMRPSDDADRFLFLMRTAQEWQFLTYLSEVGQLSPDDSRLKGAKLVRDDAIDMWNEWMASQLGREWFRVMRRMVLNEDFSDPERGLVLTAGERMITAQHCEGVMVSADAREATIALPDGSERTLYETEEVVLQCMYAPPSMRLRMLPLHEVVSVAVLNE